MKHLLWGALVVMLAATSAFADWRVYYEDGKVIASEDYLSNAPYRGMPSVWVRWHYKTPKDDRGGSKRQFAADCTKHRLLEISFATYDKAGNYVESTQLYDAPRQYPLKGSKLNQATYELLCQ